MYVCMYIYIYIYTFERQCMYVCIYIYTFERQCMYVCIYIYTFERQCMYVCIYIYIYIYIHIHTLSLKGLGSVRLVMFSKGHLHQAVYKESPEDYQRLQPPVPQTALSAALRKTSPQHPIPH